MREDNEEREIVNIQNRPRAHAAMVLWPLLRAMQNADNFNDILADAVDGQEGQARKHQFACIRPPPQTATVGKPRQGTHAFI